MGTRRACLHDALPIFDDEADGAVAAAGIVAGRVEGDRCQRRLVVRLAGRAGQGEHAGGGVVDAARVVPVAEVQGVAAYDATGDADRVVLHVRLVGLGD